MTAFLIEITGDANAERCDNVQMRVLGIEYSDANHAETVKMIRYCADKIERTGQVLPLPSNRSLGRAAKVRR